MFDSQKLQRSQRTTPYISKQSTFKDDHSNIVGSPKTVVSFTLKDFDEHMVSVPHPTELDTSNKLIRKSPVNSSIPQVTKLLRLATRANSHRDADSFHKHSINSDLKKSPDHLKKHEGSELTEAQKEELALKNQRKAMKRLSAMKFLSGKMYVNELWSKKQIHKVSSSPGVAENTHAQPLNLSSRSKQNSQDESSLAFRRNFKKKIANDLFSKYQSGVGISDKDITIDPPLYEQAIQSGLSSPSARFLQNEYEGLQHRGSPVSIKELRRTSIGKHSRNDSEDCLENNLLRVPGQEPKELNNGTLVSLPNINTPSLLLKNCSINYLETPKEGIMLNQKLSYRNSLFDISNSQTDLKEFNGVGDQEKTVSVVKSQVIESNASQSLFKVSNKLRKLVLAENTPRKDLSSRKEIKSVRSKMTISIKAPVNNSKCDSMTAKSIVEDQEHFSKDKCSFRVTPRLTSFQHSAREISLTLRKVKSQTKPEPPMLVGDQSKIRMRRQKENKIIH